MSYRGNFNEKQGYYAELKGINMYYEVHDNVKPLVPASWLFYDNSSHLQEDYTGLC